MSAKHGYVTAHQRVSARRSKATTYACVKCAGPAAEWAYNHEAPDGEAITDHKGRVYSNNPRFYVPMCVACHRSHDVQHAKPNCPKGHPYSGDNLIITKGGSRVCRECRNQYQRDLRKTPEHKARERVRSQNRSAARPKAERRQEVTHCPKGHAYEGYNLIINNGKKKCRECGRARSRRYYHEHKAAV